MSSLLQIQAALTAFRSLQAERPIKLREFDQRLENFSDERYTTNGNKAVLSAVKRSGNGGNAFRLEESDFAMLAMRHRQ
jgi:hypothetical protein